VDAGVARATINPPIGAPMAGFAGRGLSTGIHDDLTATALVLRGDGATEAELVLIACDLLSLSGRRVSIIRRRIADLTGIRPERVLVSSSHNHYGPVTDGDALASVPGPQVDPYMDDLAHVLAGVVRMAARRLTRCRMFVGTGAATVGVNRRVHTPDGVVLGRNPDGPFDPRLGLLRIEAVDGRPVAVVLNYACHAVSLGDDCTDFTADFPGVARRVVEQETGALCLYMQGAAGDVDPLSMRADWLNPVWLGLTLGAEAIRVFGAAHPVESMADGIVSRATRLELPPLLPVSEEQAAEQIEDLQRELASAEAEHRDGDVQWARARIEALAVGLRVLRGEAAPEPVRTEITAVRLAHDVGLVTAPGEIFTEIGRRIVERAPFATTFYSGYTNGSIDYVPTRKAYEEGGYEVTHGCRVAPEGGEILEEESVRLLESVRSERR
jgi:hypothetical protein